MVSLLESKVRFFGNLPVYYLNLGDIILVAYISRTYTVNKKLLKYIDMIPQISSLVMESYQMTGSSYVKNLKEMGALEVAEGFLTKSGYCTDIGDKFIHYYPFEWYSCFISTEVLIFLCDNIDTNMSILTDEEVNDRLEMEEYFLQH